MIITNQENRTNLSDREIFPKEMTFKLKFNEQECLNKEKYNSTGRGRTPCDFSQ